MNTRIDTRKLILKWLDEPFGSPTSSPSKLITDLDDADLSYVRHDVEAFLRALRDLKQETAAEIIERKTNYDKLIRRAKKMFTETDIEILEAITPGDYALNYSGLEHRTTNADRALLRKRVSLLRRRGLVVFVTGLWDEDGMPAGSGFMQNEDHADTIESIIKTYRNDGSAVDSNQTNLLEEE